MKRKDIVSGQVLTLQKDIFLEVDHYKDIATFEERDYYDECIELKAGEKVIILDGGWIPQFLFLREERLPLALVDKGGGYIFFLHDTHLEPDYFTLLHV